MECDINETDGGQRPMLRMSLWQDVHGGFNSCFHGQICIVLDDSVLKSDRTGPQWLVFRLRHGVTIVIIHFIIVLFIIMFVLLTLEPKWSLSGSLF